MSNPRIEFYFDYISPYSYLAWFNLKRAARKNSWEIIPRPVVLAAFLNKWGHKGPAEIPPKREFTFKDCLRKADQADVPFFPPPYHPFNPLPSLRVSLNMVSGENQMKVIDTLWRTIWGEGKDGGSLKVLSETLNNMSLPGETMLGRLQEKEVKDELKKETEYATQRGVFGVPTMIVEGEVFWGNDQIEAIEIYLSGMDPLQGRDIQEILSRPASAKRKQV